jgi:cell pole-organizing protein PopZ
MTYSQAALHSCAGVIRGDRMAEVPGDKQADEDVRMTQPAKSQEPSMEEILASIRRIIADDDATKTPQGGPGPESAAALPAEAPPIYSPPPAASHAHLDASPPAEERTASVGGAADPVADMLDLTESMAAPMPQSPPENPAPGAMSHSAPLFRTIDGSSDVGFDEASEKPVVHAPAPGGRQRSQIISNEASAAVDTAFNALAQTVLAQNARTLEDLVREMLRPMLKSWLDDNLPGMVERLVRAEIERVSRGRAG